MAAVTRLKPGSRVSPSGRVLLLLADVLLHLQTVNCTETVIRNCESLSRLVFFFWEGGDSWHIWGSLLHGAMLSPRLCVTGETMELEPCEF